MNRILFREYSILCIGKIWVDWPGMGLLIYLRSCFGPSKSGLCFGLIWRGLGCYVEPTIPLGLAGGILGPFLYPYQLSPSPCVRIAWARAVIFPAAIAISTCLLGNGLIKA